MFSGLRVPNKDNLSQSLSTFFLSEGGTVVADAGAVSGSHNKVVWPATDQVSQRAVGAGAAAGEGLPIAGC